MSTYSRIKNTDLRCPEQKEYRGIIATTLSDDHTVKAILLGNIQRYTLIRPLQLIKLHHFKLERFKSI